MPEPMQGSQNIAPGQVDGLGTGLLGPLYDSPAAGAGAAASVAVGADRPLPGFAETSAGLRRCGWEAPGRPSPQTGSMQE